MLIVVDVSRAIGNHSAQESDSFPKHTDQD